MGSDHLSITCKIVECVMPPLDGESTNEKKKCMCFACHGTERKSVIVDRKKEDRAREKVVKN